ncbi:hypothetical protein Pan97_15700 [Bremerella volcania]|uniref:Uncharacterized protein n=1 Tax=Bremerella volcania TaxID=2527984 RepID=A0A518C5S3_9BACT|nr:hypothetical protein [Bremerella volcania]QDU74561.1 hypothetical protein Pan97_15700 [Bremerella volcania]
MNSNHKHDHAHHERNKKHQKAARGLHKDWRTWTVVLLMLLGMAVYLLTMDESLGPATGPEPSDVEAPAE